MPERKILDKTGKRLEKWIKETEPPEMFPSLAVVLWGGIGDAILFSPVLRGLRKKGEKIFLFTHHPIIHKLFITTHERHFIFSTPYTLLRLLRILKPQGAVTNVASPSFKTSAVFFLSRIPYRAGFPEGGRGFLYNIRIHGNNGHEVERNMRILEKFGLSPGGFYPDIPFKRKPEKILVIHPGSGPRQLFKRWDPEKFGKAGREMEKRGWKVLIAGWGDEINILWKVGKYLDNPVYLKSPSLSLLVSVFEKTSFILANDTSFVHLGALFRVPSVVIFGPTDERRYHPWGVPYRIVKRDLPCRPCFNYKRIRCDVRCIKEIEVEDIMEKIDELLEEI